MNEILFFTPESKSKAGLAVSRKDIQGSGEVIMAELWNLIGVILGIIFVILLVSSIHVDDDHQDNGYLIQDYAQEEDLLEELILIEDLEEELEDDGYYGES